MTKRISPNPIVEVLFAALLVAMLVAHAWTWTQREQGAQRLAFGQERLTPPLLFSDPDSYTWLTLAKATVVSGVWRQNWTDSDNPPDGRPTHWNSLLVWLLVAAGWLRQLVTREPLVDAIDFAAWAVNPFLQIATCAVLYVSLRKVLGAVATWITLVLIVLLPSMAFNFAPGRPDHQSLAILAMAGTWAPLIRLCFEGASSAGTVAGVKGKSRWHGASWVVCSAVSGAFGLWFGASVQVTVFALVGEGIVLAILLWPTERTASIPMRPDALCLLWGAVGFGVTCLLYLVQYAPNDLGMQLEVIHPFYGLSWLGSAGLMAVLLRWGMGCPVFTKQTLGLLIASLSLALVLPLAFWFGSSSWHVLHDPLVRRFQTSTFEGRTFVAMSGEGWYIALLTEFGVLFLMPLLAVLVLRRAFKLPSGVWAAAFSAQAVALGYGIFFLSQIRWINHFTFSLVVSAALVWVAVSRGLEGVEKRVFQGIWIGIIGLALLAGAAAITSDAVAAAKVDLFATRPLRSAIPVKKMVQLLRERHPEGELRVIIDPGYGPATYHFGKVRSLGSLFWQNAGGLRDHMAFLMDETPDAEVARRIARERQLDYVLFNPTPVIRDFHQYVGLGADGFRGERRFFMDRLKDGFGLPEWIERDWALDFESAGISQEWMEDPTARMFIYRIAKDKL